MKPEEKEFEELMAEIKAKEARAYKRATLYTAIPVLVGLIVLGITIWQVVELEQRKEVAIREAEDAKREKEKVESDAGTAKNNLDETIKALEEAKQALLMAEEALKRPGRDTRTAREVNTALKTIDKVSEGGWVVISGDKTLDEAQAKVQRAQKLGYRNVAIYLRQNSYRTLIQFSSEAEARAKFPEIRSRLSATAYLRDLNKWCPNPQQRRGYVECPN